MAPITTNTVKQLCTRNVTLKLLSLALAFCVWSISAVSRETEARLTLPVRLSTIPHGYVVGRPVPASINVTLSGPLHLITTAKQSGEALTLDLEGAVKPGTTAFTHLESYLKLPQGITVIRISPASLEIRLETEHSPQGDLHQ
jgi:hypothetical protein